MSLHDTLRPRFEALESREEELQAMVADPELAGTPHYPGFLRELGGLQKLLAPWRAYSDAVRELAEARVLADGEDADMATLAKEEIPALEETLASTEAAILERAVEEPGESDRTAIFEIRAGTGGDEAALFVADLFDLYSRFADSRGWDLKVLDRSDTDQGGFRELVFQVSGEDAFRCLQFESGTHRVQRVPTTESQGRIHTSAATVAVLPEVEDLDFELKPEDLEFTAMRSSGPGGQHVNKTSSAVRVTHIPTGEAVRCQESKLQHQNRERALALLRARLFEREKARRDAERAETRRSLVGTGDRSQRIRTYNWPQNRVTDHRIGANFSLEHVLAGRLDDIVTALLEADREAKVASLDPGAPPTS